MLKKLLKDTSFYAIGPQIPKLVNIVILPILLLDLTEIDYGVAGILMAYLGSISAFKFLGLEDIFVNYFYKHPKFYKIIWSHIYGFLSCYMLPFSIIVALVIYFIYPKSQSHVLVVVLLHVISKLIFEVTNLFGFRVLQLNGRSFHVMMIAIFCGAIGIILNLITISYFKLGFLGWFITAFCISLTEFVIYAHVLKSEGGIYPIFNFRWRYIKKYLKLSLPMIPNKYGHYFLNSSDRVVMDVSSLSVSQIGIYNFGYNLANYFQITSSAIGLAVGPIYLKLFSERTVRANILAQQLTFLIQIIFFIITFSIAIWMKELFLLIGARDNLQAGYTIAIIILIMQNYAPLRFYFTNAIIFNDMSRILWKITFVAGILNIGLNFLLIPYYGIKAAAITTFFSMFYISVAGYFFKDYRKISLSKMYPLAWFFISSLLLLSSYGLKDLDVVIKGYLSIGILLSLALFCILYKNRLKEYYFRLNDQ